VADNFFRRSLFLPRHVEDIETRERTLFHGFEYYEAGTPIRIVGNYRRLNAQPAVITRVDQVRLLDHLDEDLPYLGKVTRAEYLDRWNRSYPEHPSRSNPVVWRTMFVYEDEHRTVRPPVAKPESVKKPHQQLYLL
jgi:hypothetical protein